MYALFCFHIFVQSILKRSRKVCDKEKWKPNPVRPILWLPGNHIPVDSLWPSDHRYVWAGISKRKDVLTQTGKYRNRWRGRQLDIPYF